VVEEGGVRRSKRLTMESEIAVEIRAGECGENRTL